MEFETIDGRTSCKAGQLLTPQTPTKILRCEPPRALGLPVPFVLAVGEPLRIPMDCVVFHTSIEHLPWPGAIAGLKN